MGKQPDNERRPAGERSAERIAGQEINTDRTSPFATLPLKGSRRRLTDEDRPIVDTVVDFAIDNGSIVVVFALDIVVVPDLMLIEYAANGNPSPHTITVRRPDGRSASLYAIPERTP